MRLYKIVGLVVVGMVALAATKSSAVSAAKTSLVYGESGRLEGFDPYTIHEASGHRLADMVFSSLINVGPSGEYVGEIANKWVVGSGNTYVDFDLKNNVYWHYSSKDAKTRRQLTAKDVITTVRLLQAKASEIPNKERFQVVQSVEKLSEFKVRVRLKRAMADPLRVMMFKILPDHILGGAKGLKRKSQFAMHPIGTGPFVFSSFNQHGEVRLKKNPVYFGKKPKIEQIVMKSFADQNVMAQSLMFNSLDLITYVSPRNLQEVKGDKRLSVVPYDALSFSFFAMNNAKGILRDKRVRQAISFAVNRQEMLQAFFQGNGQLISGPFPPTSWAYNLDVQGVAFDQQRAKRLLSHVGLKDKDGDGYLEKINGGKLELDFAVPLTGESETIKRLVLAFQGYLKQVGLKVNLRFMDWVVWKKQVIGARDFDMTIASWSFDDASNITSLFHSSSAVPWGNNFVGYRNNEVDSLLSEADATSDFDKKRKIYHKLHAILADEAPYTYLWTLRHHAAHSAKLGGVRIEPFAFFKYVNTWRLKEK